MENKTKLAELLAQTSSIESMSTSDLDTFYNHIDSVKSAEYAINNASTLWHALYDCRTMVRNEQEKRAKGEVNDIFLTLLEDFQKRCNHDFAV